MSSELPGDAGRLPKWVPVRGPLLGILVLFVMSAVVLSSFRAELTTKETEFIFFQTGVILSFIIGGGIGGIIQLLRQGRTAEIPRFFRFFFLFAFRPSFESAVCHIHLVCSESPPDGRSACDSGRPALSSGFPSSSLLIEIIINTIIKSPPDAERVAR
jgi:hypothetical protein